MSEHLNIKSSTSMKRKRVDDNTMQSPAQEQTPQEQDPNFYLRFNAFDNIHSLDNINMSEEQRLQIEKEIEEQMKHMNIKGDPKPDDTANNDTKK
ncbi:hypothetical protein HW132_35220 [Brasilonema sp. CT11]|nr:hypothetical protein [Brasilonema sp. CT11]